LIDLDQVCGHLASVSRETRQGRRNRLPQVSDGGLESDLAVARFEGVAKAAHGVNQLRR
jgi:hypothetical protein